jgi:uncharacterized delta-60 repeat protein
MNSDFEDRTISRGASSARLALSLALTLGAAVGCGEDENGGEVVIECDDAGVIIIGDGDGDGDGDVDASVGDGDGDGDGDGEDAGVDSGEPEPTGFRELFQGVVPLNTAQADRFTLAAFGSDNTKFYAAGFVTDVTTVKIENVDTFVADSKMAVARFTLDGKLDTTFGDLDPSDTTKTKRTGVAKINLVVPSSALPETSEAVKGLVVQADGKILIAGTTPAPSLDNTAEPPVSVPQVDVVIARLTDKGELDKGETGFSVTDASKGYTVVNIQDATESFKPVDSNATIPHDDVGGLTVDAQGRIVLFARAKSSTSLDANRYVLRFSADGVPDNDFGTDGRAEASSPEQFHENAKLGQILANGDIVSPGYTSIKGKNHIVVAKFNTDGDLVETFGEDGVLAINPFIDENDATKSGFVEAYAAAHQSDGRFVTTGYGKVINGEQPNSLLSLRFNGDGVLDNTSYGLEGKFYFNLTDMKAGTAGSIQGRNAIVLKDDRIVQIGNATPTASTANGDGLVLLLTKDGRLDTSFNTNGFKAYEFGLKSDALYGLALSPDGKHLVATGYAGATVNAGGQNPAAENAAVVIFATE